MASTRDLRRRIKSIKNTSQITKAMQMVSAIKMRKAQNQALSSRPYTETFLSVLVSLSGKVKSENHQLLNSNSLDKVGVMILSTDKGLCGALNTNLFRFIQSNELFFDKDVVFYTIGKKGRDFIVRTGKNLYADFESLEHIEFQKAASLRKLLISTFLNEEVGEVYLLYPHFLSTLRQEPRLVKVLPIDKDYLNEVLKGQETEEKKSISGEILFEPTPDQVLDFALTHFIDTQIYQALLEMRASEHSARMMAMQNATDNAKELVVDLQLTYNQMRQDAITKELLEITSAAAALE
ncbi:MAG: ATP synthase F1, gamma subunit [Candidatus Daviesbacteria bacterium GW2011_GWA1_41_61]|uniref:ATP synthase gamma chain n=1 Tax=Candidatus Daviesbacteria bacterium GW2011_GWA2_40_9 TaxID=1618424 RepID=A0A0G0U421_9BACT|nr:MAG: ATP synthase gamma chain [Candidatus Daviesbacteria bacterium GW2011_GWC1_40_9]KKR83819.1 MAG: ATP synthase F1, gamma subunit [Candidatus Daviesbacteria bacterium GW2011_GWA2_40_9]KKR93428.1 MAG: ATP synthase F1, gamma subunit [Candidatus Daviesbacteria bacterium GW2011_GWB1_41_15]KKS15023.1 MAG: ATP synthase F1, gamma subunit [Candidatus Daviesbacteria bacterium GW2011_GWA1_41_61]